MNKKGMGFGILGVLGFFIIILAVATFLPVEYGIQTVEEAQLSLNWENSTAHQSIIEKFDSENIIVRVVYRLIDPVIYASFEISKLAGAWAVGNLAISLKLIIWLVALSLLAPIVLALLKIILIIIIFIKDLIQNHRDKKEIRRLQNAKK